jgi:hypothetical protein
VLTLSIIHNPAFIVAVAFWAATLVIAAVFVKTAPVCDPSDIIDFKDFNSRMAILATAAFAVVVLSIILNVSPLLSVALVFLGIIFVDGLYTFIDPFRTWKNWYICDKRGERDWRGQWYG